MKSYYEKFSPLSIEHLDIVPSEHLTGKNIDHLDASDSLEFSILLYERYQLRYYTTFTHRIG